VSRKVRNVVRGLLGLVAVGLLARVLVDNNPERAVLEALIAKLDIKLVQQRAIARDLDRYRSEVERLAGQLKTARRRLDPDLDAIARALEPDGVKLEAGARSTQGFYRRCPFTVSGTSEASLGRAIEVLEASEHLIAALNLDVTAERWKAELMAFEFVEALPTAAAVEPPPPQRWYSRFNDDLRREVASKSEELAQLAAKTGDASRFPENKKALQDTLGVLGALEKGNPPILRLVPPLFVGPDKILERGRIELTAEGLSGAGDLRVPMPSAEALDRLGTGVELITWRGEGRSVELALRVSAPDGDVSQPRAPTSGPTTPR
jgi:hypothetical protein